MNKSLAVAILALSPALGGCTASDAPGDTAPQTINVDEIQTESKETTLD